MDKTQRQNLPWGSGLHMNEIYLLSSACKVTIYKKITWIVYNHGQVLIPPLALPTSYVLGVFVFVCVCTNSKENEQIYLKVSCG